MTTTLDVRTGPAEDEIVLDGADGRQATLLAIAAVGSGIAIGVGAALLPAPWSLAVFVLALLVLAGIGVAVLSRRARVYRLHLTADALILVDGRDVVRVSWDALTPITAGEGAVRLSWGDPGAERAWTDLGRGLDPVDQDRLAAHLEARRRRFARLPQIAAERAGRMGGAVLGPVG